MKLILPALTVVAASLTLALAGTPTHATEQSNCLDPKSTDSFTATFTRGTGTIATKNGKALCADAQLYLESFQLPDTWDGKGWNMTAIPQTQHAAMAITVPSGQANFKKTYTIDVPEACKATQLDFYLAPEVKAIVNFHDGEDREIRGQIFKATSKTCEAPKQIKVCELATKKTVTINEKDFDAKKYSKDLKACEVTPPVTPQTTTPETPAELPQTGSTDVALGALGLGALVAATYYYIVSRRQAA